MTLAGEDPIFQSPYTDEAWYGDSAKIDVAVVMCGVYDMISQWEHDQITRPMDHITERYMGGTPMNMREKFYQASPLYHASSQNAVGTKWLLAWGTADSVVDYKTQSLPFLTALTRAGAFARSCGAQWEQSTSGRWNPSIPTSIAGLSQDAYLSSSRPAGGDYRSNHLHRNNHSTAKLICLKNHFAKINQALNLDQ